MSDLENQHSATLKLLTHVEHLIANAERLSSTLFQDSKEQAALEKALSELRGASKGIEKLLDAPRNH